MPGLRGFSEANIKKMRTFYEEWRELDAQTPEAKSLIQTSDLPEIYSLIQMNEIQILPFNFPSADAFPGNDFRSKEEGGRMGS